jgi:hypothetical protein
MAQELKKLMLSYVELNHQGVNFFEAMLTARLSHYIH